MFLFPLALGLVPLSVAILQGDIVLVGMREFQDDKTDVIHKYSADEARQLVKLKQIPASGKLFSYGILAVLCLRALCCFQP